MQVRKRKIEARLRELKVEMGKIGPLMRGSIVKLKIGAGEKKYPSFYFSVNMNGKTKLVYLGEKRMGLAKQFNENYLKLWKIVDKMTLVCLDLLKQD